MLTFENISSCAYSLKYGVIFKAIWQTVLFCKIILFLMVGCNKDTTLTPPSVPYGLSPTHIVSVSLLQQP